MIAFTTYTPPKFVIISWSSKSLLFSTDYLYKADLYRRDDTIYEADPMAMV